ncbi:hypothetical protein MXB_3646, partial [Myxobolus squamalis]
SLHLSYFCVQFKSSYIAALCIQLACSWAKFELKNKKDEPWWFFIDKDINFLYFESKHISKFLAFYAYFSKIIDQCPLRIKSILIKFNDGTILEYNSPIRKAENQKFPNQTKYALDNSSNIPESNKSKISSLLPPQLGLNNATSI